MDVAKAVGGGQGYGLDIEQQALVDAIAKALGADPEIEAAWLGGSLGRGAGDAFSDVDIVALVADAPAAQVGLRYSTTSHRSQNQPW